MNRILGKVKIQGNSNTETWDTIPWAAAIADILATSTAAEDDTPLPSGTPELTWIPDIVNLELQVQNSLLKPPKQFVWETILESRKVERYIWKISRLVFKISRLTD